MLEEIKVIDQTTVTENGILLVRQATKIMKDGVQIAPDSYHRWSFAPGSDVSALPQSVQDIANLVWTPEVIAGYQAKMTEAI